MIHSQITFYLVCETRESSDADKPVLNRIHLAKKVFHIVTGMFIWSRSPQDADVLTISDFEIPCICPWTPSTHLRPRDRQDEFFLRTFEKANRASKKGSKVQARDNDDFSRLIEGFCNPLNDYSSLNFFQYRSIYRGVFVGRLTSKHMLLTILSIN